MGCWFIFVASFLFGFFFCMFRLEICVGGLCSQIAFTVLEGIVFLFTIAAVFVCTFISVDCVFWFDCFSKNGVVLVLDLWLVL